MGSLTNSPFSISYPTDVAGSTPQFLTGVGGVNQPVQACDCEDEPLPGVVKEKIHFHVALFFDGTNNNKFNVERGQEDATGDDLPKGDSYVGDYTNIAKMEMCGIDRPRPGCDEKIPIYVQGAGTLKNEEDRDKIGSGLGMGETGIWDRVDESITQAVSDMVPKIGAKDLIHVHIDTFGFSRGAAAARLCIWKALEEKKTNVKARLSGAGHPPGAVAVKFVGLFDTVASYGTAHWNDTSDLHLDAVAKAEKVVQLAAAEEHRANFRLTNIKSAGGKGKQYFLPGVHSDIGGGYTSSENETDWCLYLVPPEFAGSPKIFDAERNWLTSSGWYKPSELQVKYNRLVANRSGIRNGYANIPLKLMAEYARGAQVFLSTSLEDQHPVPSDLANVESKVRAKLAASPSAWFSESPSADPQWHKDLRHKYLHFSSRYEGGVGAHDPQYVDGKRGRKVQNG